MNAELADASGVSLLGNCDQRDVLTVRLCFPVLVFGVILSTGEGDLISISSDDPLADLGDPSEIGGGGPPISHIGRLSFSFTWPTGRVLLSVAKSPPRHRIRDLAL